ncbi:hypothetical protein SEUBUCD646_0M04270 [Saccharomyces eubayanus]|uniref:Aminodeoxychorismate lyase n=2 Tax=Saccharomyces TaxID=4930 RepID=A0A6C1EDJ1_SACPS|nr:Aminodeoxychorismate lyase [Saccharomyces pastorianus]CAI1656401.1 hypothetical protein SEUBUCD650_0M04210 [Saccharomyces eubayanus]CAI1686555.1 hypothetical protein SEUBUCD646_0M04270 [Saccharomyces eubayanus]
MIDPEYYLKNKNVEDITVVSDFEVLATFRYDPGFTRCLSSKNNIFECPAVELGLRDDEIKQQIIKEDYSCYLRVNEASSGADLLKDIQSPNVWKQCCKVIECYRKPEILQVIYERFFLLEEQYQRLRLALSFFRIDLNISLHDFFKLLIETLVDCKEGTVEYFEKVQSMISEKQCYKMRVLVSKVGSIRMEAVPLPMTPIFELTKSCDNASNYFIEAMLNGFLDRGSINWDVVIASEPINKSVFTSFKTTSRGHYTSARTHMQTAINKVKGTEPSSPVSQCEILLSNKSGQLMEGSITNVAIIRRDFNGNKKYVTPKLTSGCLCGTMRHYLLRLGLIEEDDIEIEKLAVGDEVLLFNGVMGCIRGTIRIKT